MIFLTIALALTVVAFIILWTESSSAPGYERSVAIRSSLFTVIAFVTSIVYINFGERECNSIYYGPTDISEVMIDSGGLYENIEFDMPATVYKRVTIKKSKYKLIVFDHSDTIIFIQGE